MLGIFELAFKRNFNHNWNIKKGETMLKFLSQKFQASGLRTKNL